MDEIDKKFWDALNAMLKRDGIRTQVPDYYYSCHIKQVASDVAEPSWYPLSDEIRMTDPMRRTLTIELDLYAAIPADEPRPPRPHADWEGTAEEIIEPDELPMRTDIRWRAHQLDEPKAS